MLSKILSPVQSLTFLHLCPLLLTYSGPWPLPAYPRLSSHLLLALFQFFPFSPHPHFFFFPIFNYSWSPPDASLKVFSCNISLVQPLPLHSTQVVSVLSCTVPGRQQKYCHNRRSITPFHVPDAKAAGQELQVNFLKFKLASDVVT